MCNGCNGANWPLNVKFSLQGTSNVSATLCKCIPREFSFSSVQLAVLLPNLLVVSDLNENPIVSMAQEHRGILKRSWEEEANPFGL